jgi:hypothetical protein
VALAIALLVLSWSIGGALLAPGTDSVSARLAEWARSNELGWVVDGLEHLQYDLNPPPVGGTVAGGIPVVSPDQEPPDASDASPAPAATDGSFTKPASRPGAASGARVPTGTAVDPPTSGPGPSSSAKSGAGSGTARPTPRPGTASSSPAAAVAQPTPSATPRATPTPTTPAPKPIPPQVRPSLPSEGVWQTLVSLSGQPAMRVAFLRPDALHTGYLVSVVWLDQRLVKLVLHPGYQQPGGAGWSQADHVPTSERSTVLATFNSGFRLQDSNGGYWADGMTAAPLRAGAASMVFYKDGHVDIVKWGTSPPGSDVAAVRQNLVLLVDNGVVPPAVDDPHTAVWGTTYTTLFYVWRTALGIRADGSLVFAIGPALNVGSLARLMEAAGAVRAIELDINPSWTHFMTYTHPNQGDAVPHMLTQDQLPEPYRYLQPSSRDFVEVLPRS